MAEQNDNTLPVNFATFVVSLAQSTLLHLGETTHPATGQKMTDLKIARYNIDILGVLKNKTTGNLDEEETKLIDTVLYDCRVKYLAATGQKPASP